MGDEERAVGLLQDLDDDLLLGLGVRVRVGVRDGVRVRVGVGARVRARVGVGARARAYHG